ncbi:MAG TPA: glycosyltransferase [Stellaceae bacterium]|nr:glycosyltransferase [Stellaceae bacterium]
MERAAMARMPVLAYKTRAMKLIFLVTEDWYFWSHRLPMARAARRTGFEVAVATRVTAHGERIRALGYALHPLRWRRGRIGPLASALDVIEIWRLYRRERPLAVHHVSLKPALLGGIAARLAGVPLVVSMITGTGYLGSSPRVSAKVIAFLARRLWPAILLRKNGRVIVQNEEDRLNLVALRPDAAPRITVIPGSGVDTIHFAPAPEPPAPPVVAAYAGRMIAIKGVAVLVEAQQILQRRGMDLRLVLAGEADAENPSAIDRVTLEAWSRLPGVTWRGRVEDIREIWRGAHIAVLASLGGEGLSKSLLEAAAMGRPIIATDIAGSRDIARNGVNAILVPLGDAGALAEALAGLAGDAERRRRYGAAGRKLVESRLSDNAIETATETLYRALLASIG